MIASFNAEDFVINLRAALRAASEDLTRAHLACVRVELDTGAAGVARFVATNGHWVWLNEVKTWDETEGAPGAVAVLHIHRDDVKTLLRGIVGKKGKPLVNVDTEARTVTQGPAVVSFRALDVTFPPYAQILPGETVKKAPPMSFDACYITEIAANFRELVGKSDKSGAGLTLEQGGTDKLDPIVITSSSPAAGRALAILMPRREDDAHGLVLANIYRKSAA